MERRSELRLALDQAVRITCLDENRHVVVGRAVNLSGRGIRVLLPDGLRAGQPVRVDVDDTLLLGEVCYCEPGEKEFVVGIEIDQALGSLSDLARLNRALLGERVILPVSEQA